MVRVPKNRRQDRKNLVISESLYARVVLLLTETKKPLQNPKMLPIMLAEHNAPAY